jgi:oligogalacturonide lyase
VVFSRRVFLSSFAAAGAGYAWDKGAVVASEAKRYPDLATEFSVSRLTDPAHQCWLPAYYGRAVSRRGNFLIYASDRSGSVEAYRLDMKSGQSRDLTDSTGLVADSITLSGDERSFCYVAGRSLYLANLANLHTREVYKIADGYDPGHGFSLTEDGLYAALVEQKAGSNRLRLITMRNGAAETLVESTDVISDPMPRPRRAGMLYRRGADELWLVNFDGAQNHKLKLAAGGLASPNWSPDGRTVFYLNLPAETKKLNNIREFTPDSNEDRFIANTSQFVAFNRNADGSVFVGASVSKASPYMLVLVRSVKRELTLCEHRASDPRMTAPIFSPNSQRVFFQSDKDGKMAIYAMSVDRLVEETETEDK